MVARRAVLAAVLGWSACGLRSAMNLASPDADGLGSPSESGAGGAVPGGSAGFSASGGTASRGAVSGSGGGGETGGRTSTAAPSGGATTVAHGGSSGTGSGAGAGRSGGGAGGKGGAGGSGKGGTGGKAGAGGTTVPIPDAASPRADPFEAAAMPPTGTPAVDPSGYTTIATGTLVMSGYVSGLAQGSGSSITLTYDKHSICASGTVSPSTTFKSWAVVAFSVNQEESGLSGSTESLILNGSELTLAYENRAGSQLDFQLWDGDNFWCHFLPTSTGTSSIDIPFSTLNTACWDGSGSTFTSGTPITSVQLVVPGSPLGATPFDFCFLGLTVR
jgi:hypothetical protein